MYEQRITAYDHAAARHVSSEVSLESSLASGGSSVSPAKVTPGVTCIVRRQMLFPYHGLRLVQDDLLPSRIGVIEFRCFGDLVIYNDEVVRI